MLYLKKTDICINNPKNSSTNKMKLHTACGYSLLTKWYHWNIKKINHVIKKIYYVSKKINNDYDDNTCYLREKEKQNKKSIKVVFHNGSTYDYCFITRASKRI